MRPCRSCGCRRGPASGAQPVFDLHFHLRAQPANNLAHLDGAGIAKANLLTRAGALDQVKAVQAAAPGRFTWFSSADITKPEAEATLTQAVKDGARGFGELKFHVAADGPELRRMYALAAELQVPILIDFQEVDHYPNEGTWSTGFARTFEGMLKVYPKTTFIGHADAFWANVSADYRNEAAYPAGPIKRGGITDRLLADYANLYGDLAANSGNNAMTRDPEFTAGFLAPPSEQAAFRQRLRLRRRTRRGRRPVEQSSGEPPGGQVRGARDAHDAEETGARADVPQDRLGQRTHAAEDSRLRANAADRLAGVLTRATAGASWRNRSPASGRGAFSRST